MHNIHIRFNVLSGLTIIPVLGLDSACSLRQTGEAIVLTESGVRLSSIFAGIAANPKFYQIASGALSSPGRCIPKKSGI
jgi:hypothetical protein